MHKQITSSKFGCVTNIGLEHKAHIGEREVNYSLVKEAETLGFPVDGVAFSKAIKCNIRFAGIGDMHINNIGELESFLTCVKAMCEGRTVSEEVVNSLVGQPHMRFATITCITKDIEVTTSEGDKFTIPAAVAAAGLATVIPAKFKEAGYRLTHVMSRVIALQHNDLIKVNTNLGASSLFVEFLEKTVEAYKEFESTLDTTD